MKTIGHPLFILLLLAYVVYYVLKHLQIPMPELITNYFADLLSLFLINTFVLFLIRKIVTEPTFELSPGMVVISLVLITVIFEIIQPAVNSYFVADPIDVICYGLSATLYLIWRKTGTRS